ncbi:MAG: C40 family peptidase [Lachnospiraceae bacterium]|nr:C40 family peptidase [Lachnospiraceae bacterium]MBQ5533702.1 C40 family peptidase [Lachnospiraceae bacterium]
MTFKKKTITFILTLSLAGECMTPAVFATSKTDLKKDAAANQKKLDAAQAEISSISEEKESVEAEMEAAQEELVQLLADVEILKSDIEKKNVEIEQAQADYDAAKLTEERQYNAMRARIKYMYENGGTASTEYLDIFLHSDSITDAINKAAYASKLYEYDRTLLTNYIDAKEEVAERQRVLEEDLSELEEVKTDLEEKEEDLNNTIAEQRASIENFSSKLAAARSQAKAYKKKIDEDNAKIAKIVAAEKEAARKKAEEEAKRKKAEEEARRKSQESSDSGSSGSSSKSSGGGAQSEGEPVSGGSGSDIASYAQRFIGNPYVPGGTSLVNGCDCSGFVWAVYNHFGYSLPRQSGAQGASGSAVDGMENAQPGDIFYYVGHVGIYIGNGYIVHASTPATGIKVTPATYRSIASIRRIV